MKKKLSFIASLVCVASLNAELKEAKTENDLKKGKVLAKFSASWCGACKTSKKPFTNLSNDPAYKGITFADVDVDATRDWNGKYKIESLPTFVLFVDGKETGSRVVGYSEDRIKSLLNSVASKTSTAKSTAPAKTEQETVRSTQTKTMATKKSSW